MSKYLHFLKSVFIFTPVLVFAQGCTTTTTKEFTITGSNKRDRLIELSFDYSTKEIPEIQAEQPHDLSLAQCKQWGYTTTVQSESLIESCVELQSTKCLRKRATIKFQCQ